MNINTNMYSKIINMHVQQSNHNNNELEYGEYVEMNINTNMFNNKKYMHISYIE